MYVIYKYALAYIYIYIHLGDTNAEPAGGVGPGHHPVQRLPGQGPGQQRARQDGPAADEGPPLPEGLRQGDIGSGGHAGVGALSEEEERTPGWGGRGGGGASTTLAGYGGKQTLDR